MRQGCVEMIVPNVSFVLGYDKNPVMASITGSPIVPMEGTFSQFVVTYSKRSSNLLTLLKLVGLATNRLNVISYTISATFSFLDSAVMFGKNKFVCPMILPPN